MQGATLMVCFAAAFQQHKRNTVFRELRADSHSVSKNVRRQNAGHAGHMPTAMCPTGSSNMKSSMCPFAKHFTRHSDEACAVMSASSSSASLADHYHNDMLMDVDTLDEDSRSSQHFLSCAPAQYAAAALSADKSCSITSTAVQVESDNHSRGSSSSGGTSSTGSSSSEGQYVHQAWQLKRPVLQHDPKLTRRQLRQMNRCWTLAEVATHKYCDDGWIAVEGQVYDITGECRLSLLR